MCHPWVRDRKVLSFFATGATQAISSLRKSLSSLQSVMLDTETLGPSLASGTSAETDGRTGNDEIFTAQWEAISVVEQMYLRIIYVLELQRIEPGSSDHDIQAEMEDAAITSWPHLVPETFISSLDSGESLDIPTGFSFTILAHLYLLLTLLDGIWYLRRNFGDEIGKIHTFIAELGDPGLLSLMKWPMNVVTRQTADP